MCCNVAWDNASSSIIKPLEILPDKVSNIIPFAPCAINYLCSKVKLSNMKKTHKLEKVKFMFNLKH